ncbi:unnamed protein product [Closterium sp. NIES-54]
MCALWASQCGGGCQRSTGDPRLIIGKGYRLVVLGGYGRTDLLLNKPFYPNALTRAAAAARVAAAARAAAAASTHATARVRAAASRAHSSHCMHGFSSSCTLLCSHSHASPAAAAATRVQRQQQAQHLPPHLQRAQHLQPVLQNPLLTTPIRPYQLLTTPICYVMLSFAFTSLVMAAPHVLRFDAEGRALEFPSWLIRAERFLKSQRQDNDTLWAHASGDLPEPPSPLDLGAEPNEATQARFDKARTARSVWQSRDAAACIALSNLLPETEEAHFSQVRFAKDLLAAIKTRYFIPTSASLGRLFLPFLFPDLGSFDRAADLITHLRSLDVSYCAACTEAQLALPPPAHGDHYSLYRH